MITAYEGNTLFDALKLVFETLGRTNHTSREAESIMGGKILEYEAQRIYNEAEARGEARGEAKGEDITMDLVSQLVLAGNYEELTRMAQDREYSRQKIRSFKEG